MKRTVFRIFIVAVLFGMPGNLFAQPDLSSLNLEDLMEIQVTSVSRKEENIINAPAAVSVLTNEDIRRSGASSIPEILRLVPGMHVARSNSSTWAISSRGFTEIFANKLLVMIDGRTVYSPIFSGTYWDMQDYVLEDIERIEVVRGPGGTLWGSNAVNGVINIITKNATKTPGVLLSTAAGNSDITQNSFRYGGQLTPQSDYRLYAKYRKFDELKSRTRDSLFDDWHTLQTGFRIDASVSEATTVTLQGDAFIESQQLQGRISSDTAPYSVPFETASDSSSGNLLARVKHSFSDISELSVQAYFDRTNRASYRSGFHGNTFDLDVQHSYATSSQNELVYGLGLRLLEDEFYSDGSFFPDPKSRRYQKKSAFLQNTYAILPSTLKLLLGAKVEHNDFAGFDFQPNARLQWSYNRNTSFWGALSRAVRTPSRYEHDLGLDVSGFDSGIGIPGVVRIKPNPNLEPEQLLAYELGVKYHQHKDLSAELALFYNDYHDVTAFENLDIIQETQPSPKIVQPIVVSNTATAQAYGAELSIDWSLTKYINFIAGYSYLNFDIDPVSGSNDPDIEVRQDQSPQNQFSLRTKIDFNEQWQLDPTIRYVDTITGLNIDSYVELDLRLGFRPDNNWEFAVVGQNLLDSAKQEYLDNPLGVYAGEVQRSIIGKITVRF